MSQTNINIAGGGSAGWMVAATLSHFLPGHAYRIRLIESEAIGTVGVGEATIPQIQLFNQALGLDEDAFLRATGGTFKLGIEFAGWTRPGERYMHAFGDVGRESGLLGFHHRWLRARAEGSVAPLGSFSLNEVAARADRMQRGPARTAQVLQAMPYAFHFDAALYGRLLRRFAETRGVKRIEGRIVSVERNGETGDVSALALDGGACVTGDLFIDCTGFAARLIGDGVGVGYNDWTRWLPCDRALAVPSARATAFTPYTRATAQRAGWQWRIPLQHRTGNGIVYCSRYLSQDAALERLLGNIEGEPLTKPNLIRFTTGARRRQWHRNCIAIGLSGGFMEPLESTSLHLIQRAIIRLIRLFPHGEISARDVAEFNDQQMTDMEQIRDFLILHYKVTERDDSAFWRFCRDMHVPDTLSHKIELFRETGRVFRRNEELFAENSWVQVMMGQGIIPRSYHPIAAKLRDDELDKMLTGLREGVAHSVDGMPEHAAYVARYCGAARPAAA